MLRICEAGYTRITKTMARKLHNQGKNIYITPCKMRLINHWTSYGFIPHTEDFDKFVNTFEIYNCNHRETGMYAAFYIDLLV